MVYDPNRGAAPTSPYDVANPAAWQTQTASGGSGGGLSPEEIERALSILRAQSGGGIQNLPLPAGTPQQPAQNLPLGLGAPPSTTQDLAGGTAGAGATMTPDQMQEILQKALDWVGIGAGGQSSSPTPPTSVAAPPGDGLVGYGQGILDWLGIGSGSGKTPSGRDPLPFPPNPAAVLERGADLARDNGLLPGGGPPGPIGGPGAGVGSSGVTGGGSSAVPDGGPRDIGVDDIIPSTTGGASSAVQENPPGYPDGTKTYPSGAVTYTIQPGDSLSLIGAMFGVTYDELIEGNEDLLSKGKASVIHPGDTILITPPPGRGTDSRSGVRDKGFTTAEGAADYSTARRGGFKGADSEKYAKQRGV